MEKQPLGRKVFKERRGQGECGARRRTVGGLGKGKVRAGIEPELLLCTIKDLHLIRHQGSFQHKDSMLL